MCGLIGSLGQGEQFPKETQAPGSEPRACLSVEYPHNGVLFMSHEE